MAMSELRDAVQDDFQPQRPTQRASPHINRERYPIKSAHNSVAGVASEYASSEP